MFALGWRKLKAVVLLTVGLAIAAPVVADRGGHGGHGGGGADRSSRSSGGGGGGSSLRSFSGGGGSGGSSSRTFRSFSGGDSGGSGRSSFRSLSGGDGGNSSRSFRSLSGGNGGSRSLRSFDSGSNPATSSRGTRSDFHPSGRALNADGGGGVSPRTFSGSNSDRSIRSLIGSNPSLRSSAGNSLSDSAPRVLGNNSPNVAGSSQRTLQLPAGSDAGNSRSFSRARTGGSGGKLADGPPIATSFEGGPVESASQTPGGRGHVNRERLHNSLNAGSGNANSNIAAQNSASDNRPNIHGQQLGTSRGEFAGGARNQRTRPTTGDEVRNFLNLPGNNQANDRSRGTTANVGQPIGESPNIAGDGARGAKLGKRRGLDAAATTDVRRAGNNHGSGGDLKHLKDLHKGHEADREFHGREFHGRDVARGEFDNWSKTWKGKQGEGHDHRDWSGKWREGGRFDIAHDIRHDWHTRHAHHDHNRIPFCGGWWGHNHHHGWGFWNDYCVRWHRPWFWWSWTTAPALYDWCGFGWSTPYYWDYGPGEYIFCNDGVVYVNGTWYQPAPVFYQQTVRMVEQAPVLAQQAAAQIEWLPLGVFAVTPDGLNEPTVTVQLAVTKEGIIGGTAFDEKTGKSYNIQGTVDKNTQRAVWSYNDDTNNRIVMETSVNNLTQNESTGLVHYSANDMRVVQLVRLQEPEAKPVEQPAGPLAPPQGK